MDITPLLSGHGHVVVRRGGGKGRCRGPAHCGECANDAALVALKKGLKAGQDVATPLAVLVETLIFDNKEIRALAGEDTYSFDLKGKEAIRDFVTTSQHSFDLLRRMEQKGFKWQMTTTSGVSFTHLGGSKEGRGYRPATDPLSIVEAALEAVGLKIE